MALTPRKLARKAKEVIQALEWIQYLRYVVI